MTTMDNGGGSPRLLVVDDDPDVLSSLERGLRLSGFEVATAVDGAEALRSATENRPDAIVLDINMPVLDGVSVVTALRAMDNDVPVCVLSARSSVDDRVAGLEAGADDYLVKPFDLDELLARIVAVQRRVAPPAQVSVQGVALDLAGHRARRGDESIDLTAMEWAVLECLASRTGRICSRDAIVDALVGQGLVGGDSNSLEVIVSRLRKKLGAAAISTHRGLGYRLDA